MSNPVKVVKYNPKWQKMYEKERERISSVIGDKIVAIEHIGSTSIPGVSAKPIVDILIGVSQLDIADQLIESLESIGYEYVPKSHPDRRLFGKGKREARSHHLHVVEYGSDAWEKPLLFRDYLWAHPEIAQQYDQLKIKLAAESKDRPTYTDAKTRFIESVIEKARAEGKLRR